jgi:hypothetical protein
VIAKQTASFSTSYSVEALRCVSITHSSGLIVGYDAPPYSKALKARAAERTQRRRGRSATSRRIPQTKRMCRDRKEKLTDRAHDAGTTLDASLQRHISRENIQ